MSKKDPKHIIYQWMGYLLTVLSVYYLYTVFVEIDVDWNHLEIELKGISLQMILGTVTAYSLMLIIGAYIWSWFVSSLEKKPVKLTLLLIYWLTNIQKYIPGNVVQFLGRNLLGAKHFYSHKSLATASLLEIFSVCCAAGSLFLLGLGVIELNVFNEHRNALVFMLLTLFLVLLLLLVIYLKFKKTIGKYLYGIWQIRQVYLLSVLLNIGSFLLLGLILYILMYHKFENIDQIQWYFLLVVAYAVSWLVGFVLPGVPGGVGVRESVFLLLMTKIQSSSLEVLNINNQEYLQKELLFAVIILRIVGLVIEFLFAFMANLLMIRNNNLAVKE